MTFKAFAQVSMQRLPSERPSSGGATWPCPLELLYGSPTREEEEDWGGQGRGWGRNAGWGGGQRELPRVVCMSPVVQGHEGQAMCFGSRKPGDQRSPVVRPHLD